MQFGHLNGACFSGARRRFVEAANLRDELQKGARRHIGTSRRAFGQIAEMALRRQHIVTNIHAHNARRAAARAQKAGNHFHRRRFTSPIGSQKAHYLTARDGKGQIIDGGKITEFFNQMFDFNHARYSSTPRKLPTFR